ncbi:MAG: hypothetical protein ACRENJ_00325 [Candidatus Eiseniibacteriota bacterium]
MRTHRVILGLLVAGASAAPLVALSATAPARAVVAAKASRASAAASVLPWIEDDYPRAMAEAKARKTPIFVESWAPW